MNALTDAEVEKLTRRGLRLAQFTVGYNVIEGIVAITAGIAAGLVSVIGFGIDSGIESIAAVPGVDAIFIGPADLSAAMGHVGQPIHPEVMDLVADVVQRCKAIGKPVGAFGATPEVVAEYRAIGFDFVAIASDLALLIRGAKEAIAALKSQDRMHVHTLASGTQTGSER